jgi:hypothetical protein
MISPHELLMSTNGNSQDDILGATQKNPDFENSYLLTELASDSSRTISPNTSALNTSQNLRTGARRRALKSQSIKDKEK